MLIRQMRIAVYAGVSELADETDSKSVVREGVWVRVPPPAVSIRMGILFEGFPFLFLTLQISPRCSTRWLNRSAGWIFIAAIQAPPYSLSISDTWSWSGVSRIKRATKGIQVIVVRMSATICAHSIPVSPKNRGRIRSAGM